jgi:ankyrin repeat protein
VLGSAAALALLFLTASQDSAQLASTTAPKLPQTMGDALHSAVRAGSLSEVQRLIAAGVPVDVRDDLGSTPLLDAAWALM